MRRTSSSDPEEMVLENSSADGLLALELDAEQPDGPDPAATTSRSPFASRTCPGPPALRPAGLVDDQPDRAVRPVSQYVEATGQGCMARTRLWIACSGRDQSIRPSSLRSFGALVTFDRSWGRILAVPAASAAIASATSGAPSGRAGLRARRPSRRGRSGSGRRRSCRRRRSAGSSGSRSRRSRSRRAGWPGPRARRLGRRGGSSRGG